MSQYQIEKCTPSGEDIVMSLRCSICAGPWGTLDHFYEAACGCAYSQRAHRRGEGWDYICPAHRGNIKYVETDETRAVIPYGCSSKEYLRKCRSEAFIAFLMGEDYLPRTFEYGTNAGDFNSPLSSMRGKLWYHRVRQGENTRSAIIAEREEVAEMTGRNSRR